MRVLLSAVGTRGDVQPLVAVALELRALGHEARLAVPPNLVQWVSGFGFEAVPVGIEMRAPSGTAVTSLSAEQLKKLRESMPDLITDQFEKVGAAAEGCSVILGANAHQYAARSIAEKRGVPYVTALYAPVAIPSPDHAPPPPMGRTWTRGEPAANARLWEEERQSWNARALERVNANRERLGLAPIEDVLGFNLTAQPWLATDPRLAPGPQGIIETGAWILKDEAPLSAQLQEFLEAGSPPIYFGFGSMPAPASAGAMLLEAARAVGRRAVISRGWAGLALEQNSGDALVIGEVNQQALFPRTAAIVHHGGAGTTAVAARSGRPQVIAPMFSDQFYWASRVRALSVGTSVEGVLSADRLAGALETALHMSVGLELTSDGAKVAAGRLVTL